VKGSHETPRLVAMCCASLDGRAMARRWTLTRGGCQSQQGPGVDGSQSGANSCRRWRGFDLIGMVDRNILWTVGVV